MTTEQISPVKSCAPAHALLNNKGLQTIKSDSGAWHEVSSLSDIEASYKHLGFYIERVQKAHVWSVFLMAEMTTLGRISGRY